MLSRFGNMATILRKRPAVIVPVVRYLFYDLKLPGEADRLLLIAEFDLHQRTVIPERIDVDLEILVFIRQAIAVFRIWCKAGSASISS